MEKAAENRIPCEDIERLVAAHDGDVALLFLYLCRRPYDPEKAALELCRTGAEVASAAEKLRRLGLFPAERTGAPAPVETRLPPPDELPEYTADDIGRRTAEDGRFRAVVAEAQSIMGRSLSGADMKILFGIYDYLSLPPEVILELLNFCVDRSREKYGPGRLPSMRAVEKEAYLWANMEILTLEQAEEYIRDFRARRSAVYLTAEALGIRGRELTSTEQKYISSWLDMGFGPETVEIAYDRTVTNTGALKWQYMNRILQSWDEKGLHSPGEIAEKDGPRRPSAAPRPAPAKPGRDSLRALKEKINGK